MPRAFSPVRPFSGAFQGAQNDDAMHNAPNDDARDHVFGDDQGDRLNMKLNHCE